jgi:hypothetical protein
MSLDLDKIGQMTATLFDELETDYEGRELELRAALVAVDLGVLDADGDSWTHVRWRFAHAPHFDAATASSTYLAGVAAMLLESAVQGEQEMAE